MLNKARKRFYEFRKFGLLPEQWAYFLASKFNPNRKTRFVIFGQGRTGSTLLVNLLNQHPAIYSDNELLQRKFSNPIQYLQGRALMHNRRVYGLKVKSHHLMKYLEMETSKPFIHNLYNKGWKIIYIRRSNFFRHALSNEIAKKRGYFFKDQAEFKSKGKVHIDPEAFRKAIKARFKFWYDEQETLEGLDYKEVIYEDNLFNDEQKFETVSRLYQYLGVDPDFKPTIPFIRSTSDNLSEIIANYAELKAIANEHIKI